MTEHDLFVSWVLAHVASALAALLALAGILPPVAAGVALVWYFIQIFESETCKKMRRRWRQARIDKLEEKLHELKQHHELK